MMKKTPILFDLDGTLLDSISIVVDSFRASFAESNLPYPGDEVIKSGIGRHLDEIFDPFIPAEKIPQMVNIYRRQYLEREHAISLFPQVLPALTHLAPFFSLGIVTTKLRSFSEDILERLGIFHFFEVIIGSEDVERCKPFPDPLLLAAQRFSVDPQKSAYIGDSLHDAESARLAKMPFYGVATGTACVSDLQKYGKVFAHVGEFAQFFCDQKQKGE